METESLLTEDGAVRDFASNRVRLPDHETSHEGARAISYRAGSQKAKLLATYWAARYGDGLTDEEAASRTDLLRACYWKRCNELREDGLIETTGATRPGDAGVQRIVCAISLTGRAVAQQMGF